VSSGSREPWRWGGTRIQPPRRAGDRGPPGEDPLYDGFYYFHDFDLLRRGWKLGCTWTTTRGRISRERSRGFLEYALGRAGYTRMWSKPVTDDPWLLARFIREAARFCGIAPHSLHVSLDIPPSAAYGPVEDASDLLCLCSSAATLEGTAAGT
jgi:hypothetical protein